MRTISIWSPFSDNTFSKYDDFDIQDNCDLLQAVILYEQNNYVPYKTILILDDVANDFIILDENRNLVESVNSKQLIKNNDTIKLLENEEQDDFNDYVQEMEIVVPTIELEEI